MQPGYLPLTLRRFARIALAALMAILIAGAASAFTEPAITSPATGMTQAFHADGASLAGDPARLRPLVMQAPGPAEARRWTQLAQADGIFTRPHELWNYRGRIGTVLRIPLRGSTDGTIWGTDIYSDRSHIATAAVHAGVLRPGERADVFVEILPGRQSYQGSQRNGVTSRSGGSFDGSFRFVGAPIGATDPEPTPPEPTPPTTPTPPGVTQPGPAPDTFGTGRPPTQCGFGQRYCPPGDWGPGGCYSYAHAYCRRGKTCQRGYEICPPGPHGPGGCYRAAAHLRCIEGRLCRFAESLCVPSDGSQPYCYLPGFGRCD